MHRAACGLAVSLNATHSCKGVCLLDSTRHDCSCSLLQLIGQQSVCLGQAADRVTISRSPQLLRYCKEALRNAK